MKTIITIQHTISQETANGMVGSWSDWPLTAEGHKQALRIGAKLKAEIGDANFMLYTSDLLRALQTAELVGSHFGFVPHPLQGLRPQHLGSAVGKTMAWYETNILPRTPDMLPSDYRPFPDAESNREFLERVHSTIKHILAKPDDNIMLIAHADTLNALFVLWTNDNPQTYHRHKFKCSPGSVSVLGFGDDGVRHVAKLNDTSFLSAAKPNNSRP